MKLLILTIASVLVATAAALPVNNNAKSSSRVRRQDANDPSYNVPPDPDDPSAVNVPDNGPAGNLEPPAPENNYEQSRFRRQDDTGATGSINDGDNTGSSNTNGGDNTGNNGNDPSDYSSPSEDNNNSSSDDGSGQSDDNNNDRRKRQLAIVIGGRPGYYGGGGGWGGRPYGRPWGGGGGGWGGRPWGGGYYNPYRPYPYYPSYYGRG